MMRRYVDSQKRIVERKVARQIQRRYASVTSGETITPDEYDELTPEQQTLWQPVDLPGTHRRVRRRWRLKSLTPAGPAADGEQGFMVFVNDAPLLATQLARYLTQSSTTWPKGERRPLP